MNIYLTLSIVMLLVVVRMWRKRNTNRISDVISYAFYYYFVLQVCINMVKNGVERDSVKIKEEFVVIFAVFAYILLFHLIAPLAFLKLPKLKEKIWKKLQQFHENIVSSFSFLGFMGLVYYYISDKDVNGYVYFWGIAFGVNLLYLLPVIKKESISEFHSLFNISLIFSLPILILVFGLNDVKGHIALAFVITVVFWLINMIFYAAGLYGIKEDSFFGFLFLLKSQRKLEKTTVKKWLKKMMIVFVPWVLLCAQFLIENTIEFYYVNKDALSFSLGDFYIKIIIIFVTVVLFGSLFFIFFKVKVLRIITGLINGVNLAAYLQVMIFNKDIGITDTQQIDWSSYTGKMIINSFFWVAVIGISIFLVVKYKNKMMKIYGGIAGVLIILQLSAVLSMYIKIGGLNNQPGVDVVGYYLDGDKEYEVSDKQNVMVFVLDTFSNDFLDETLEKYPDLLENYKDFTYFNNYDPKYDGTALAMNYLLSGTDFDASVPCEESSINAFSSHRCKNFYNTLSKNNYDCRLYTDPETLSWISGSNIYDKYSNVNYDDKTKPEKDYYGILNNICKGSAYRMLPLALKPHSIVVTADFSKLVQVKRKNASIEQDDKFFQEVEKQGLEVVEDNNILGIYHFQGMHGFGATKNLDSLKETAKANMDGMLEYIDALKEAGVYDNTVIIITADHGMHETIDGIQPIFFIKGLGEKHEKIKIDEAPVCAEDFFATIIKSIDNNNYQFGKSVFDYFPSEKRERTVYIRKRTGDMKKLLNDSAASYNYLYEYKYIGDKENLRSLDENEPAKKIPLIDFWQ